MNVSFPRFVDFCVEFLSQFGCLEAKVLPADRDSALASLGANAFQELIGVAPEICVHRVDQDSLESSEQWIAEIACNHQVAYLWISHLRLGKRDIGFLSDALPVGLCRRRMPQLPYHPFEINVQEA